MSPRRIWRDYKGHMIRVHSRGGYMRGCRCKTCRTAHAAYRAARRAAGLGSSA